MQSRCSLCLAIASFLAFGGLADQVRADVNGSSFHVHVRTSDSSYTDVFTFGRGAGNTNQGPFTTRSGGVGSWQQQLRFAGQVSFWSCSYMDGPQLRVDLSGVQFGVFFLIGSGSSNRGDEYFIITDDIWFGGVTLRVPQK